MHETETSAWPKPSPRFPVRTPQRMQTLARSVQAACVIALMANAGDMAAASSPSQPPTEAISKMRMLDAYPLITTPSLFEARDFYVKHFGFEPIFQASWFVYLSAQSEGGGRAIGLAFMHPDHPSRPPGPESFSGKGMILTIQVADAAGVHMALAASGAPIVHPLSNEPWGQRRFMTQDPSGMLVDVVEQTEPAAGFWERYPAAR